MITVSLRWNSAQLEIYQLAVLQYAAAQLSRSIAQLAHFLHLYGIADVKRYAL
jgi:hypothetical protein